MLAWFGVSALRGALPIVEAPSLNVTEPVAPAVTVAVNVTGSVNVDGLREEVSVVVATGIPTSVTSVTLVKEPFDATRRMTYKSAISGVNVGLRMVVDDSCAEEPAG